MRQITFNNTRVSKTISRPSRRAFGELASGIVPVFSGKTALALILRHFRSIGALENKSAEVLVPPWLGVWVYLTMGKYCFPTTEDNARVRGMLVYHQWGFPQRMGSIMKFAKKRRLFVVEDCAHALESYSNGKRVGTFGNATVFSFAKFFPCVVGGAVYSTDSRLRQFVKSAMPKRSGVHEKQAFAQRERYDKHPTEKNGFELEREYAIYDRLGACAPKALSITMRNLTDGSLERRRRNAKHLREEFDSKDRLGLYEDTVTPWVVPLFFSAKRMRHIATTLNSAGVESGIFHFDVNRNMLDPDYRECLAVPCHDGITDKEMDNIIRIIKTTR